VEGLRRLFDLRPDLVVLDVMMPQLDGWETASASATCPPCPIIMLTARGQEAERVRGLELGADDYVPSRSASKSWRHVSRPCCGARARRIIPPEPACSMSPRT
jgi:CheY-like chemotaxis protein